MFCHIFLESVSKLLDVFPSQGKTACIGMTSEVHEQVAAALDGRINVKSCHTAGRAGSHVAFFCEYHGGAEINRYLNSYLSMAGRTQDVYEHPFYVDVYAENKEMLDRLVSVVKEKLIGAVLIDGSNEVNIAASVGSTADHDSTLRPTVYQRHMRFYVNLDRGD